MSDDKIVAGNVADAALKAEQPPLEKENPEAKNVDHQDGLLGEPDAPNDVAAAEIDEVAKIEAERVAAANEEAAKIEAAGQEAERIAAEKAKAEQEAATKVEAGKLEAVKIEAGKANVERQIVEQGQAADAETKAENERVEAAERTQHRGRQSLKWTDRAEKVVLSLWLLTLYITLILFVVFSFSAYQFHLAVRQSKVGDDQQLSIGSIIDLREALRSKQDQLDSRYDDIYLSNGKVRRNAAALTQLEAGKDDIYDTCKEEVREVFKAHGADFNYALVQCSPEDAKIGSNITTSEERQKAADAVEKYQQKRKAIEASIAFAISKKNEAAKQSDRINAEIDSLTKGKNDILGSSKIKGVADFIAGADFFDPGQMGSTLAFLMPNFLIMPTDTLVLIIVVSMGALGGAIQITRNFLSPEDLSNIDTYRIRYRYIFFQPFLGAITALAIFILFKAGVMVASSTTGSNQDVGLNPFFISFLGIISGLMANVALDTIIKVGENYFRSSGADAKARWVIGLEALITAEAKKSADVTVDKVKTQLLTYIAVSKGTLDAWIQQAEPVPFNFQKLIAVFFKKQEWELFTDVPLKQDAGAH